MKQWLIAALILSPLAISNPASAETLPHLVQSARAVGQSGFVRLQGPGKIEIRGKVDEYSETAFISATRISSLSRVFGQPNACVIHYQAAAAMEIAVLAQTCEALLEQLQQAGGN